MRKDRPMTFTNKPTGSLLGASEQLSEQLFNSEQSFNGVRFDASGLPATV